MMTRPIIVTHRKPHLDEICAIWLLKKFHPDFKEFDLKFISAGGNTLDDKPVDSNPQIIHIGVGKGKFDEHSGKYGDKSHSSASLVWDFIIKEGNPPRNSDQLAAVHRLVRYVVLEDTGQLSMLDSDIRDFSLSGIFQGARNYCCNDNEKLVLWGIEILDILFISLIIKERLRLDWENSRVDFETKWGRASALETRYKGVDNLAYSKGYVLVAIKNPFKNYIAILARADSNVDLTEIYKKLQQIDKNADWFLHHSKKMLLCGGDIAPEGTKLSSLSLKEIIDILKC